MNIQETVVPDASTISAHSLINGQIAIDLKPDTIAVRLRASIAVNIRQGDGDSTNIFPVSADAVENVSTMDRGVLYIGAATTGTLYLMQFRSRFFHGNGCGDCNACDACEGCDVCDAE